MTQVKKLKGLKTRRQELLDESCAVPVCLDHVNCSGTPYLTTKQVANLPEFNTVTESKPKQFKKSAQKLVLAVLARQRLLEPRR